MKFINPAIQLQYDNLIKAIKELKEALTTTETNVMATAIENELARLERKCRQLQADHVMVMGGEDAPRTKPQVLVFDSELQFLDMLDGKVYSIAGKNGLLGDILEDSLTKLIETGQIFSLDDPKTLAEEALAEAYPNVASYGFIGSKEQIMPYLVDIVIKEAEMVKHYDIRQLPNEAIDSIREAAEDYGFTKIIEWEIEEIGLVSDLLKEHLGLSVGETIYIHL